MNDERIKLVLRYYKEGKRQREIGSLLGITPQAVSQIEKRIGLKRNKINKIEKRCAETNCSKTFLIYPRLQNTKKFCSPECRKKVIFRRCWMCKRTDVPLYDKNFLCRECNTKRLIEYRKTKKGKESIQRSRIKSEKKFPQKVRARWILREALKKGLVEKSSCFCGATKVDAHHDDYSKPLEVVWYCRLHHLKLHK